MTERTRRGKFVVRKTDHGFYYTLVAANGEPLVVSEMFETRAGALNGARSVVANAGTAAIEEPED